jgi:dCMP deaminase
MSQIPIEKWLMSVAEVISTRSSCSRGSVGCVLATGTGKILATGYNSPPSRSPHCIDTPCAGADKLLHPDSCQSVHAEISALMQCPTVLQVDTVVVTLAPCFRCTKALLNSGMSRLYYNGILEKDCRELLNARHIMYVRMD